MYYCDIDKMIDILNNNYIDYEYFIPNKDLICFDYYKDLIFNIKNNLLIYINMDYLLNYKSPNGLKRIGKDNDGGYIISLLDTKYDIFLSGGISNDISFELDLLNYLNDEKLNCVAFDGTINNYPINAVNYINNEDQWIPIKNFDYIQIGNQLHGVGISHKLNFGFPDWANTRDHPYARKYIALMENNKLVLHNNNFNLTYEEIVDKYYDQLPTIKDVHHWLYNKNICFIRKNLGNINSNNISNLREYFDKYNNMFIKLDIEGGEYELFDSLSDDDLKKIKQLVIEFHDPYNTKILERLAKTHWLVHFHPNNCCCIVNINGINVPTVFECTYILKNEGEQLELNKDPIPNPLYDMPNVLNKEDIILSGYPFN
jgi:hypothetical protein